MHPLDAISRPTRVNRSMERTDTAAAFVTRDTRGVPHSPQREAHAFLDKQDHVLMLGSRPAPEVPGQRVLSSQRAECRISARIDESAHAMQTHGYAT